MDKEKLIQEIIELHQATSRDIRHFAPEAWMGLNLTIGQLKSLFFIAGEGSTNFRKLALALGRTPPDVTRIVDHLVEQGLVSRRENPEDRRMQLLQATDQGQALIARLRENRMARMQHILSRLSVKDLEHLARGLSALASAAKIMLGEGES